MRSVWFKTIVFIFMDFIRLHGLFSTEENSSEPLKYADKDVSQLTLHVLKR